jgi:hypothetical protein
MNKESLMGLKVENKTAFKMKLAMVENIQVGISWSPEYKF